MSISLVEEGSEASEMVTGSLENADGGSGSLFIQPFAERLG